MTLNRSVLIIKAKEPFRQWINSFPDPDGITLEELNEDTTSYLIPEYDDDDHRDRMTWSSNNGHFAKPLFSVDIFPHILWG